MKPIPRSTFLASIALVMAASGHAAPSPGAYPPLPYQPMGTDGQALVDMEVLKHPELKILTVHVTPPGVAPDVDKERRLMFSNIGRVGKIDNDGDAEVFRAGKELVEVLTEESPPSTNFSITASPKYEVLVPLNDASGKKIGLIVMIFPYHQNFDLESYHQIARDVTAELSSRVKSKDDLFRPAR
jgi:hypothetical protein